MLLWSHHTHLSHIKKLQVSKMSWSNCQANTLLLSSTSNHGPVSFLSFWDYQLWWILSWHFCVYFEWAEWINWLYKPLHHGIHSNFNIGRALCSGSRACVIASALVRNPVNNGLTHAYEMMYIIYTLVYLMFRTLYFSRIALELSFRILFIERERATREIEDNSGLCFG